MNIIMGTEQAKMFEGKYTVLELDTLKFMPDGALVTAYCVVENIPLTELAEVADLQKVHLNLLEKYNYEYPHLIEQPDYDEYPVNMVILDKNLPPPISV